MIGVAVTEALPLMRLHAESLMTDTCTIERQTTAWDEGDQQSETTWATVHVSVPCHIEEPSVAASLLTAEAVTLEEPLVRLPHTYAGILPDDRVSVAGREVMWVTRAAHDDSTHPVEMLLQCRWTR